MEKRQARRSSDPEGSDEKRRAWAGVSYCLVMSNVESHYYWLLTFHSSLFPTLFVGFLGRLELFAPWLGRAWPGFDRPGQVDHGPLAGNRLDGSFVDDFLAVLSPLALDLVLVGLAGSEIVRGESSHSASATDFFTGHKYFGTAGNPDFERDLAGRHGCAICNGYSIFHYRLLATIIGSPEAESARATFVAAAPPHAVAQSL